VELSIIMLANWAWRIGGDGEDVGCFACMVSLKLKKILPTNAKTSKPLF